MKWKPSTLLSVPLPNRTIGKPGKTAGFTIVEIMIAFLIAGIVVTGLLASFSDTLFRYVSSEETLQSAQSLNLILATLRRDILMATGIPQQDPSVSPSTGTTYPKHVVHLIQNPGSSNLLFYPFEIQENPTGFPSDHPLASRLKTPSAGRVLSQIAQIHAAYVWAERPNVTDDEPIGFAVNVLDHTATRLVTWSHDRLRRSLVREGPAGRKVFAEGLVETFRAVPVIELFIPDTGSPLPNILLKTWVDIELVLDLEPQPGHRIDPRRIELKTRMIPRYLNAIVNGEWGL